MLHLIWPPFHQIRVKCLSPAASLWLNRPQLLMNQAQRGLMILGQSTCSPELSWEEFSLCAFPLSWWLSALFSLLICLFFPLSDFFTPSLFWRAGGGTLNLWSGGLIRERSALGSRNRIQETSDIPGSGGWVAFCLEEVAITNWHPTYNGLGWSARVVDSPCAGVGVCKGPEGNWLHLVSCSGRGSSLLWFITDWEAERNLSNQRPPGDLDLATF